MLVLFLQFDHLELTPDGQPLELFELSQPLQLRVSWLGDLSGPELVLSGLHKDGKTVEHFESVRLRKDGSAVPVSITVTPIRDDDDEIVGASATYHDVTKSRRAHELAERMAALVEFSQEATTSDRVRIMNRHREALALSPILRQRTQHLADGPDRAAVSSVCLDLRNDLQGCG